MLFRDVQISFWLEEALTPSDQQPADTATWSFSLRIQDFLPNRPQHVRMATSTSSIISLNTGLPQGCVLSPVFYTLHTHECVATHGSKLIIFAADTTIVGSINNDDEAPYREDVRALAAWCSDDHLNLTTKTTEELIINFWKTRTTPHSGLSINGEDVERVKTFKLGLHISDILYENMLHELLCFWTLAAN